MRAETGIQFCLTPKFMFFTLQKTNGIKIRQERHHWLLQKILVIPTIKRYENHDYKIKWSHRSCLITLWSHFIILQQIFIELLLCTVLNIMHIIDQINVVIAPIQSLGSFLRGTFLHAAIFLSGLFCQLNTALAPKETFLIMIWALK